MTAKRCVPAASRHARYMRCRYRVHPQTKTKSIRYTRVETIIDSTLPSDHLRQVCSYITCHDGSIQDGKSGRLLHLMHPIEWTNGPYWFLFLKETFRCRFNLFILVAAPDTTNTPRCGGAALYTREKAPESHLACLGKPTSDCTLRMRD